MDLVYPAGPAGPYELEIKKSRFLGHLLSADSAAQAKSAVELLREEHPGARHVVWAFRTGRQPPFEEGFSDDGEPSGTGGKPLRSLIEGRAATNLAVAVVRYFGGTKLGTGGLVRAYSEAGRLVMDAASWRAFHLQVYFTADLAYTFYDTFLHRLKEAGGEVLNQDFGEAVHVEGRLLHAGWEPFNALMREMAGGEWLQSCEEREE